MERACIKRAQTCSMQRAARWAGFDHGGLRQRDVQAHARGTKSRGEIAHPTDSHRLFDIWPSVVFGFACRANQSPSWMQLARC